MKKKAIIIIRMTLFVAFFLILSFIVCQQEKSDTEQYTDNDYKNYYILAQSLFEDYHVPQEIDFAIFDYKRKMF